MAVRKSAKAKSSPAAPAKPAPGSAKPSASRTPASPRTVQAKAPTPEPDVVPGTEPDTAAPEFRKKELIDSVLARTGVKKKYAKPVIEAMIDVLGDAIGEGREVNLQPMGKIKPQRTKDGQNARIVMAKIRQNKQSAAAPEESDGMAAQEVKEAVADGAE